MSDDALRRVLGVILGCVVAATIVLVLFVVAGSRADVTFGVGQLVGVVITVVGIAPHLPWRRP